MNILTNKWAYYNEFDPKAAAWLRQLIKQGLIANGDVDERSIVDVNASDLNGYMQCHFFAGIGGWSYALKLAGVPDDYPLWTGSCPCQPFSTAGNQKGKNDDRHLWPVFYNLIKQCRPNTIFGEQVEAAIKHGWLDDLQTDMERENYTVGAAVLGAHSVNAPHQRQRLYWVADSSRVRYARSGEMARSSNSTPHKDGEIYRTVNDSACSMGYAEHDGCSPSKIPGGDASPIQNSQTRKDISSEFKRASSSRVISEWANTSWIYCGDKKHRPVKPGIKPLVDGLPRGMVRGCDSIEPINANETQEARVMRLKGYGNAIVPQVAAQFISAFLESVN